MDIHEFAHKMKSYNGQSVTVRLDQLSLACTFINAAEISAATTQVEVNVQFQDLQESQYQKLRELVGQSTVFGLGSLTAKLHLDSVSDISTSPDRFHDDTQKPFQMVFSAAEVVEQEVADQKAARVIAELRAHGYGGFADRIQHLHLRVSRPGRQRLFASIQGLRDQGQHGLADRLYVVAEELYGAAPEHRDYRELLRAALVDQDLRGCNLEGALDAFHAALYKEAGPLSIPERTRGVLTVDVTPPTPTPVRNP